MSKSAAAILETNRLFHERGRKKTTPTEEVRSAFVRREQWANGDYYDTIVVQVHNFNPGDKVEVTIRRSEDHTSSSWDRAA